MLKSRSGLMLMVTRQAVVWVGVALILVVIGWFKTINLLLLIGYLMLALLAVNGLLSWRSVRAVMIRRRPLSAGFARQSIPVTVEIEHPGTVPATFEMVCTVGNAPLRWFVSELSSGEQPLLTHAIPASTRGLYPVSPLRLESDYPFGLVRWGRAFGETEELAVLPRLGRVDFDNFRHWLARSDGEETFRRPARRPRPGSGEIRGVRPYRAGDNLRDVHWKSTARRGAIVVREYDHYESAHLTLMVDLARDRSVAESAAALALEQLLELAMSIGWAWANGEERGMLTLVIPGAVPMQQTGPANLQFVRRCFTVLAGLQLASEDPVCPAEVIRQIRGVKLVLSTRPEGGPLAERLRRAGYTFRWLSTSSRPHWYNPPRSERSPE